MQRGAAPGHHAHVDNTEVELKEGTAGPGLGVWHQVHDRQPFVKTRL